jgi:hypothetical protein
VIVQADSYSKVRAQLKACPTCFKPLRSEVRGKHMVARCPDLYHGYFEIIKGDEGYDVSYHLRARQVA